VSNAAGSDVLSGVSCPSVGMCVAVDLNGYTLAGSSAPSVTTGPAASIGPASATLAGTVDPNGLAVDDCHFSYGVGTPSGSDASCSALPGSGTSSVAVSAQLSGLAAGTNYEFRLVARNGGGTSYGAVHSFTTTADSPSIHTLTVSKVGAGSGTVTSSPTGINCGTTCSHGFASATNVALTASPAAGSVFVGWSGACSGTGGCNVTTNADVTVTATFALLPTPKPCVVPKIERKTLSYAKRSIRSHACTVGAVRRVTSRTVKKGRVISQKPRPGKRLRHGAKVNLVVSEGRRR